MSEHHFHVEIMARKEQMEKLASDFIKGNYVDLEFMTNEDKILFHELYNELKLKEFEKQLQLINNRR